MKNLIFFAIPVFIILVAIEAIYSSIKKKSYYRLNDTITNFSLGIGAEVSSILYRGLLLGIYYYISKHYALFHQPVKWWSFILCFLTFDFLFYWAHRMSHERNFLWGAHMVHHQSEEYNLSVALRQSWIHGLIAFFIFLPVPLLGFDPIIFGIASGVDSLYQFWIHTRAIKRMPAIVEYFFNTPSHHRVHHATNPKYIDKNHGGVLIIWDRLFGTFRAEEDPEEIVYGITTQMKSWNPVWANVHYYHEMAQKMVLMKTWREKAKMVFARPGWLPDYLGGFQHPQEIDKSAYSKYDVDTTPLLKIYGTAQFIIALAGTIEYLDNFSILSTFYRWHFAAILVLSVMIVGAIFEQKRWIVWAEIARLLLVGITLNIFYYTWYSNWLLVTEFVSSVVFTASLVWLVLSVYKETEPTQMA